ncbi:right-handed parallel beta-helix repeat-containing protein [Streptomyces sp. NRRL WC-3742]|uniref:right-handed parallel beta-helix repeat-containing protein n=1 Tax=Streptomyces sp. NRRL WC-3742 TaxID=1463934 RepID=UPI0004C8F647|nr:right-handed parallel beta-helix repeat-containing protein [Streptomyces sp. NRRL WC-3742]
MAPPTLRTAAVAVATAATLVATVGSLAATPARAAVQTVLYASPSGSGSACTLAAPCSLTAARDLVRTLAPSMSGDIAVQLRGGTYRLAASFELGPQDSGTGGHTVVYQAYPGEQPVLSGGRQVTGFTQVDAAKNIWKAPAPAGAQGLQMYVNGQRADRTRSALNPAGFRKSAAGFTTADPSYTTWRNPSDVQIAALSYWKHLRCPLSGITAADGGSSLDAAQPCWANSTESPAPGYPYNGSGRPPFDPLSWIENAYELLSAPGQFYLDRTGVVDGSGTPQVYYIPRTGENLAAADVELPTLETLVNVAGTPGHLAPVNDDDTSAVYGGSWAVSGKRGYGDLGDDVHFTHTDGDSVAYTFDGTGLDVLGETNTDEGGLDVYVDGVRTGSASAYSSTRLAQQVIASVRGLAKGSHTVKLVKTGGGVLTVDAFTVVPDVVAPVHDIAFQGITFSYATWLQPAGPDGYADNQAGVLWAGRSTQVVRTPGAVQVHHGQRISITGGEISHVGGNAVDLADGTQDSGITGNRIQDTSGAGVWVGEVDDYYLNDTALMTSGDTVSDNAIVNIGREYADAVGIMVGNSRAVTVAHNEIAHTPYSGISVGWGWGWATQGVAQHGTVYSGGNRILANYVHDTMRVLEDGGPVYTLGGQGTGDGNATSVVAGNVLAVSTGNNGAAYGLYHDEGSSNWDSYDNVISQMGSDWNHEWLWTIHDITIHNNYTDTSRYLNNGTRVDVNSNNTVVTNGSWPQGAKDIIARAGLETGYRSLMPPDADLLNDSDYGGLTAPATISYTGSWNVYSMRQTGDLGADVHATPANGDTATIKFTGTGLRVLGELSSDQGQLAVTLDGAPAGTVDTSTAGARQAQVAIYRTANLPYGNHTVTLTKTSGSTATIDGFQLDHSVNDTDPSLAYSGNWSHLTGRGFGDFNDDVHCTTTDGDSVTATFNGTGADVATETNSDEGTMDVYVDGQLRGSVSANTPTRTAQQRVYTIDGLPYGVHTLKLVKTGGDYLLVDRLTYR